MFRWRCPGRLWHRDPWLSIEDVAVDCMDLALVYITQSLCCAKDAAKQSPIESFALEIHIGL
jgi:hypothetical protein